MERGKLSKHFFHRNDFIKHISTKVLGENMRCKSSTLMNTQKLFSVFFYVETLYTSLGRGQKEGL